MRASNSELQPLTGKTFLLGIGAQKAGTSWLFAYFRRHPQVAISPIKELHYWDQLFRPDLFGDWDKHLREKLDRRIANVAEGKPRAEAALEATQERLNMMGNDAAYMRFFANRVTPQARVFGEITPSYALLPVEGWRRLKSQHDDVKLIFLMRDPVARFWSGLCHDGYMQPSLSPVREFDGALAGSAHVERTRYDQVFERLDAVFDERDVLIEFYEDLFTDPAIRRIAAFAGIRERPANFERRVHSFPKVPMPDGHARRAREAFDPVYAYCRRRFGTRVPRSWMP